MLRENQQLLSDYVLAIERDRSDFARELKAFKDSGLDDPVRRSALDERHEQLTVRKIRAANFPQRTADLCVTCYIEDGKEVEIQPAESSDPASDRFECGRCKRGGRAFVAAAPVEPKPGVTGSNSVKFF